MTRFYSLASHGKPTNNSNIITRINARMKPICKFMGKTGIDALTRIMGFLLVSMGMQFMINAVKDLLTDPALQVLCNVN